MSVPNPLPSFGIQYQNGSHPGPDAPAYCRCGVPMRTYEGREGYDRTTGEPIVRKYAVCSAHLLVRWIGFHDRCVQDSHGDWAFIA